MVPSRPQLGHVLLVATAPRWIHSAPEVSAQEERGPERLPMVWDWEAFSDLCRWTDANTPIDALFLAPADWDSFWVFARRSIVMTKKGAATPQRYEAYLAVVEAYRDPRAERFAETADQYDADYVIVAAEWSQPDMDLVYRNGRYAIYEVPGS